MPISKGGSSSSSGGALTRLSATTLAVDGTFDITSISGNFNDLLLVLIARSQDVGSADGAASIRFNNDTGANYYRQFESDQGAAASAFEGRGASAGGIGRIPQASALASSFGVQEITIPGYSSTTWLKSWLWNAHNTFATTASGMTHTNGGGQWASTAAITRITISSANLTNLTAGSQLRIYGVL